VDDIVADAVRASVAWLDAANGRDDTQITLRILKIMEEAGEAGRCVDRGSSVTIYARASRTPPPTLPPNSPT
jgi:hypothetical protein